jgi:hypothetical protein
VLIPLIKKKNIAEPKNETKRFVVYRQAVQNYFGMETFTHFSDNDASIYLAVSNKNKDVFDIANKASGIISQLIDQ